MLVFLIEECMKMIKLSCAKRHYGHAAVNDRKILVLHVQRINAGADYRAAEKRAASS